MYTRRANKTEQRIIRTLALTRRVLLRIAKETKAFIDNDGGKGGLFDPFCYWRNDWTREDKKYYEKSLMKRALQELKRRKFIKENKQGDKIIYELTDKGRMAAYRDAVRLAQKISDGSVVLVSFDIPKSQVAVRSKLRYLLRDLNFKPVQKSLWMSNADVASLMAKMIKKISAEKWVKIYSSREVLYK